MGLSQAVTLPVSVLNVGLAAIPAGINAEIQGILTDITALQAAALAQAEFLLDLPPDPTVGLQITAQLNVAEIAAQLANIVTASVDVGVDLAFKLGLVELQLGIVGELQGKLQAGVDAGGLAAWTYGGNGSGFGFRMRGATSNGYGSDTEPDDQINAVILATESFSTWGNFGGSFNVGDTVERGEITGPTTEERRIAFLGELSGGQLNTGVREFKVPIDLNLLRLRGAKAVLEAQIQVGLGFNLPEVQALADVEVDISAALSAMLGASVDLDLSIEGLEARIDGLFDVIFGINVLLSGGGLSVWYYSGPAQGLGTALETELANGLPGGSGPLAPAYGVVVATKSPSAWADFGLIFRT